MNKLVNIIIPVYNRPEHTRQTLETLFKNTPEEIFDLFIVDDNSDTETKEVIVSCLKQSKGRFQILTNQKNIGPGACRNMAAEVIRRQDIKGMYIYHSDNDVYFKNGWIGELIRAYEESKSYGVRLLGGGCHPYLRNNSAISLMEYKIGIKDAVSGYSHFMTWETWEQFGPFDETTRGLERKIMGSEDWAFSQKIVQAGFKVGSLEPEVVIATGKTNTYGDLATGSETFKQVDGVEIK